jgi:membrane protein implicated in regulation of membrane protease activity
MSSLRRFACTAALVAGAVLLFAAPAYADVAPTPTISAGMWIVIVGGLAVVIVGGLSFWALRRAAARRRAREAGERSRQQIGDEPDGSG